jgi:hypothetical protein
MRFQVDNSGVKLPTGMLPLVGALPKLLQRLLGVDELHFPSLVLEASRSQAAHHPLESMRHRLAVEIVSQLSPPASSDNASSDDGSGSGPTVPVSPFVIMPRHDVHATAAQNARHSSSSPTSGASEHPAAAAPAVPGSAALDRAEEAQLRFQLWGLTMQATSDVLELAGLPRLNWPPLRFRSQTVNGLIYAVCGGVELWQVAQGTRAAHAVHRKHVAALLTVCAAAALALAGGVALWRQSGVKPRL